MPQETATTNTTANTPEIQTEAAAPEEQTVARPETGFSFKLGCDPEFLYYHKNKMIPASDLMQTVTGGENTARVPVAGNIGCDGHHATGEVRPLPSHAPAGLVNNLRLLFQKIHDKVPTVDITTLSINSPVGGHIHLEIPNRHKLLENNRAQTKFKKIIATFLMPIYASDHKISVNHRSSSSYGGATDIRIEERDGGKYTVEVRGPSAEWVTTPKLATATLTYLAVIWHEYLNNEAKITKCITNFRTEAQAKAVQQLIISDYVLLRDSIITEIGNQIRTFELYEANKEEIEFILNVDAAFKHKEENGWNIMTGWFSPAEKIALNKKLIMNKKEFKKRISEKDLSKENGEQNILSPIPYNDDYKVAFFAEKLAERILAFNWDTKYNYFLYGTRKAIKGYTVYSAKEKKFYSIGTGIPKNEIANVAMTKARMWERRTYGGRGVYIDPKTGKTDMKQKGIVIGIPYDIRANEAIDSLISLIWELESGAMTPFTLEEAPEEISPVDTNKKESIELNMSRAEAVRPIETPEFMTENDEDTY